MLSGEDKETESTSTLEWPQPCRQLKLPEIQLATRNFDESLVIGRGGFGKVYKGTIVSGGRCLVVAIKRLDSTSNQGAVEFWVEVKMLSKLRHCHLVSLIGYCNDGREMILVYEYMPLGTLEDHLHKLEKRLPWNRRLKICIGAARGLDYLHTGTGIEQGVIHRDVKSSNILLHKSWAAKISDFGLSKVGPTNQPSTYVNTMVKGTFGYLDPDYFYTGRLTRKSDVYAFGVVLFEVLCGKRAVDKSIDEEQWGLARWAQDSIKEGRLKRIVDPSIRGRISAKCLKEFAQLADRCLHSHPKQRPTMAEVVVGLQSILALQEKINSASHPRSITIFGRKMPMFLSPSNRENYDRSLNPSESHFDPDGSKSTKLQKYDFLTISIATENFREGNKIWEDQNESMYKGMLQNGQKIAIKKLYGTIHEHIYNELLVKLEHENLVRLLGYCIEQTAGFLVYDFALYKSLDHFIFDPLKRNLLDWNKRHEVILGVANALLYLHKHAPVRIVHANVRPENILFNENMNHKLSYVESEIYLAINGTDCINVDKICGTMGYMAPEYMIEGYVSTKTDVFGFGLLVLETISGQRNYKHYPLTDENFVQYTWKSWLKGRNSYIIDPTIVVDSRLISRFIQIGLLCVQADETDRPTMDEVVGMLVSSSPQDLALPKNPVSSWMIEEVSDDTNVASDDYDPGQVEEFESELIIERWR
ncbi:putative protein kinase RLK-Pelle-CrRLK1L-1 family [Helianthus annuus]|nr:putative protein kinase RLK-Pelle-CrRLK1L-1 family [Helianthus annuus]KAJ0491908.1 putative protein kinase RLK-Pelle-CrRLK1L-1 family [Helianthus annuus]